MIVDRITSMKNYECMHKRFADAFAFFNQLIEQNVPDGKYFMPSCDTEGAVYVMIGTKSLEPKTQLSAEAHVRYIDIQAVLEGEEIMCVPSEQTPAPSTEYNPQKDVTKYEFLTRDTCHTLRITEGSFAIFFNDELHIPEVEMCGDTTHVRKAVIKVLA